MRKRIFVACIMLACLCCGIIPQVLTHAQDPCRDLQIMVQTTVGDEDPAVYRNHGKYVSTVAKLVDPYLESGEIDSVCASCIVSQFARRIPIADQEPCLSIAD